MAEKNSESRVLLVVIDGFGHSEEQFGNAISQAKTPNFDQLYARWPHTFIKASGEAVGLPDGQLGSSEVGHLTIGAGRVIRQGLSLQQHAIRSGVFFENEILIDAIERARERGSALHIMGLVSPGGVHGHQDAAVAIVKLAKNLGQDKVFVHAFLDGRDTPPVSAHEHVAKLEQDLKREHGNARIASVSGRYYAMDRDNRWERTELAYNMLTGEDHPVHSMAVDYIKARYDEEETDEFIQPMSIASSPHDRIRLEDNDVVIFFNFRPDRARQLSHALLDADFSDFERKRVIKNLHMVTFTEYDKTLGVPVIFPKDDTRETLAEIVSESGASQFHIAETEKYAHVTYFINGGREEPFAGEDRLMIPSPKVATYDEAPAMSAEAITEAIIARLESDKQDRLIITNYANPDMVGHTGIFEATLQAVEVTDTCIGRLAETCERLGWTLVITADHGNAEAEIDPRDNSPLTAHSLNLVPFIVCGSDSGITDLRSGGSLEDVAPTVLDILKLPPSPNMTGTSLRA